MRAGKGDRQRIVPLPEMVYTELLAYLLERGGKRGPLLRTEKYGKALGAKHICEVVCHAAERAGINREVTPKALRHSYATHLMDRGVDLAVIAKLMGHRSPAETGVYLHVLKDRPQRAVNRLDLSRGRCNMTWEYWICLYTQTHCAARGLRTSTIAAYREDLGAVSRVRSFSARRRRAWAGNGPPRLGVRQSLAAGSPQRRFGRRASGDRF